MLQKLHTESFKPALFEYANIRSKPAGLQDNPLAAATTEHTLEQLRLMAMPENWNYARSKSQFTHPILYSYLIHTFARVFEQGKVAEKGGFSCFNTGLVTENQEEIFMLFKKSKTSGFRFFQGFFKESAVQLQFFDALPVRASYYEHASDLLFDERLDLRINIDHIIDDEENFARFPDDIQQWPKLQLLNTFRGAVEHAQKRVKRNYLTAVPQFYRGRQNTEGSLQLLLPLCLRFPSQADLALTVYKKGNAYIGRTCLTLDMAMNNARLITKPDDEWLKP
ncbi:MAG: DUF3825 domain-containing protein [Bacteroidia bacterium]|jgi:hypothetical protein|nr:DUF3825 domain-containing protein [Bacteroidia bacterium]